MVTEVMNGPKHDDCPQVIIVHPYVYIRLTAWQERIGVANVRRIEFLTIWDLQGSAAQGSKPSSSALAKADES